MELDTNFMWIQTQHCCFSQLVHSSSIYILLTPLIFIVCNITGRFFHKNYIRGCREKYKYTLLSYFRKNWINYYFRILLFPSFAFLALQYLKNVSSYYFHYRNEKMRCEFVLLYRCYLIIVYYLLFTSMLKIEL